MAVDVLTEITINAPVDQVSAFASDPMNAPSWYDNIESAKWKGDESLKIGAQIEFVAQFLGKQLRYTYEVTELEPGKRITMKTANGPFPMETTYSWTAVESEQTHMTLRNRGKPKGFSKVFAPMMASAMRRANNKDLRMLKDLMEKGIGA